MHSRTDLKRRNHESYQKVMFALCFYYICLHTVTKSCILSGQCLHFLQQAKHLTCPTSLSPPLFSKCVWQRQKYVFLFNPSVGDRISAVRCFVAQHFANFGIQKFIPFRTIVINVTLFSVIEHFIVTVMLARLLA